MVDLEPHARGVVLPVKARAGARQNAVTGARQGELLVSVTQAPEKGKANRAIVKLLSGALGLRASRVRIVSGESGPHKKFLIVGASVSDLQSTLDERLSANRDEVDD